MAKNNNMTWIIAGAIIFILVMGGKAGWFKSVSINNNYESQLQQALQNPSANYHASMHFTPNTVCMDLDQSTGVIESNMPGASCGLYMNDGNGFKPFEQVTLDSNGAFSHSDTFGTPGIKIYKAICELNSMFAATNEATITVNDCAAPQQQLPPSTPKCVDSDGASVKTVSGTCSEAQEYGTWTAYDICATGNTLTEWSCDSFDKCRSIVMTCDGTDICVDGACVAENTVCKQNCLAAGLSYSTGGCFPYNVQGALSMEAVCINNHGKYLAANGCDDSSPLTPDICCCR